MSFATDYVSSVKERFAYYKGLGESTFEQLERDHYFYTPDTDSNNIAIIIKHMWGNMRSRWTDFLTSDGEKNWRERETEFEVDNDQLDKLMEKWEEGWVILFDALEQINDSNFDTKINIRNEEHSIIEAVNRQLAHYAYHLGQIVLLARIQLGDNWKSLSIPKGGSDAFNKNKFDNS